MSDEINYSVLGGLFLNFAIAAALDFPAKLLALVSLVWLGRRLPYISLTFLAGFSFVICLFIERQGQSITESLLHVRLHLEESTQVNFPS